MGRPPAGPDSTVNARDDGTAVLEERRPAADGGGGDRHLARATGWATTITWRAVITVENRDPIILDDGMLPDG